MPQTFKISNIPCTFPGCGCEFTNRAGLTNHQHIHTKLSLTWAHQHGVQMATPSRSPTPDAFGQADGAEMHEDGPAPFPQLRKCETITYHPFINGIA